MANIKISEMPIATTFENDDYTMIVQNNKNKKITKQNILGNIENNIGNLSNLTTTDKTSLVGAINENNSQITNLSTYSTTEKRIGTWYNNKPIYRIVLNEINITSTSHSFDVSNLDIDEIIKIMPKYKEISSGNDYNEDFDNYYVNSTDYRRTFYRTLNDGVNKTLEYRGKATGSVIYIIEYTKTTD